MSTTAKPAGDDVFDFNLNAVQAESELAPFRVMWGPDNERFIFAHLESLDVWKLLAGAEGGDAAATAAIFRIALGADAWDVFKSMPMPQYKLKALFKAYRRHCGLDQGE